MALQSSGTMSLSDVNVELSKAAGATIDTANASVSFSLSAPHSFNEFYGQAGSLVQNNIFFVFADFQDEEETDGYRGWGDGQLNLCAEADTFGADTIDNSSEFLVTSASKPDGSLVHANSEFFIQQPISNGDIAFEQSGVGDLTNIRPGGTNIDTSGRDWIGNTSSSYLRDAETPNLFRISSSGEIDRVTSLDPNGGAAPSKELASVSTNTIGFTVTANTTVITRFVKVRNGSDVGSHTAVTNKGTFSTGNSNTTVNFTGLSSGTSFNFRVRAENDSNHQGGAIATSSLSLQVTSATSASGGGGGGCFVPGSKVLMADGTTKNIENVQVGDSVMSMNIPDLPSSDDWDTYKDFTTSNLDSATLTTSSVHSNTTIESKESYEEIGLSNGTTLKVTEHHPFFIYRDGNYKWAKPISEFDGDLFLRDKDKLVTKDKELITINTIQSVVSSSDVYDLNVEDSDVYFVDGVLVHNKVGDP